MLIVNIMRQSAFKKSKTFFHLNVPFRTTGYFKELDWTYLQKKLFSCALQFNVEVDALVMMDTHFHTLICVAENNENFFNAELSKSLGHEADDSVYCEPVSNLAQYINAYKYIYNNPVDAELSLAVESYPYSSIQILLGKCVSHCMIADKMGFIHNPYKLLTWLNSDTRFKDSELKIFHPS